MVLFIYGHIMVARGGENSFNQGTSNKRATMSYGGKSRIAQTSLANDFKNGIPYVPVILYLSMNFHAALKAITC